MRLLFFGFGTVAQGLSELLLLKKEHLEKQYGIDCRVVGIFDINKGNCLDQDGICLEKALKLAKEGKSLSAISKRDSIEDPMEFLGLINADVLFEATYTDIKTAEPATSFIKEAFRKKMDVITTNKGPLALNYTMLKDLAKENGVEFLFEGTVMSGTPLLNLIRHTLAGSEITEIQGILNGTTNYILTRMEEGLSYDDALKKAQELGYAEAVPDADVLGWDALAKVTILANVIFKQDMKPFDNPCEGITGITIDDIENAKKDNKRYKLIGRVWKENDRVNASVAPVMLDIKDPLANIMGAFNAMTISTDTLGNVTIIGPGAGRTETGYSMLNDLIHIGGKRCRG